jgi:hypothetical protein
MGEVEHNHEKFIPYTLPELPKKVVSDKVKMERKARKFLKKKIKADKKKAFTNAINKIREGRKK